MTDPRTPDDEDFDEDAVTEEEGLMIDFGFNLDGSRMQMGQRRPDSGAPWHPADDEGADPGREA